jgi:hypothetical protein
MCFLVVHKRTHSTLSKYSFETEMLLNLPSMMSLDKLK